MANLTVDAIVDQAFARVGELNAEYPTTRGPMYRRAGFRQRELYARAAQLNPERFGTCATASLTTGKADLTDMAAPVPTPELVQKIEVLDKGTSRYVAGDEIHVVTVDDPDAAFAPRAYLRDGVLLGVGTDLDLVTSIKVYYAKLPALIALDAPTTVVALDAPWDTLLELDLVLWLLAKATQASAAALGAIAGFQAEEAELAAAFDRHVLAYTPGVSRWLPPHVPDPRREG